MAGSGRRHDRNVLDALEAMADESFEGEVWRVTWAGRSPLRGSTGAGRWSPPGEFEVLYTSLAREGALTEIGHRLSLEPVWPDPARAQHEVHRIHASLGRTLRFETVQSLAPLGVNVGRWSSYDYEATQAIAAAANFLEIEALVVPSARSPDLHLVVLLGQLVVEEALEVLESEPVDWDSWRRQR
jgi:hypothetical protein